MALAARLGAPEVATKRRRIGARRLKDVAALPIGARWWLYHGQPIGLAQAYKLDLGDRDAWLISNLHYDRPTAAGRWNRRDLRALGLGDQIDRHIAAGRVPPDRR